MDTLQSHPACDSQERREAKQALHEVSPNIICHWHNHAGVKACCFCGHKLDNRVKFLAYVYDNQATDCQL